MITNLELYGTEDVPKVDEKTCNRRIELLNKRLKEESSKHYMIQNNNLLNTLTKAIRHWHKLRDGEEEYN